VLGAAIVLWASAGVSHAVLITGSAGGRSASADFTVSGSNLIVTLTNTSTADGLVPTDGLTGVFFDLQGSPTLSVTGGSALLGPLSTVINPPSPGPATDPAPVGSVGSEWAFKGGLSVGTRGAYGISSSGLGIFGPGDRFITTSGSLSGPDDPDGIQYAITTAGDDPTTDNGGYDVPLIKNSVVFTLTGFTGSLSVSNVLFQYGTGLTEPTIPGTPTPAVPEPATISMILSALLPLGVVGLRRLRRRTGPASA
jgi:hypothetical protein